MKIALCILTKNERECLSVMLPKIPRPGEGTKAYDAIYAVDGGSTDGTLDIFAQAGVPVVGQSKKGRGQAFQAAFREIRADAFIFFSPDGNEDVADLERFRPLLESGSDVVIASRMMKGSFNEEDIHWFKPRKWANNIFNLMVNLFFRRQGVFISDSINGFRAITKSAAERLRLDADDYTIEYQMTIRALKAGMKVSEFPTHEGQRIAGETGAPSVPTGLRFIKRFWRELWAPKIMTVLALLILTSCGLTKPDPSRHSGNGGFGKVNGGDCRLYGAEGEVEGGEHQPPTVPKSDFAQPEEIRFYLVGAGSTDHKHWISIEPWGYAELLGGHGLIVETKEDTSGHTHRVSIHCLLPAI